MSATPVLYDFLYADHEKVASILSQLDENGAPQETAVRAQRGKDEKTGFSAKIAGLGVEAGGNRGLQYEVRQTYDPLWTNSRKLIEYVKAANLDADLSLGQLRVINGELLAFDQSVLSKLMAAGSMRDFIAAGMVNNAAPNKKNQKTISDNKKEAEVIQTYIAKLGLSIQFVLWGSGTGFWFNVNKSNLYLQDTDIPLKHPVMVSGEWSVLGIIDALPHDHFLVAHLDAAGVGEHVPQMLVHLAQLIGLTSISFGRRLDSYGLKPLAIFREVNIPRQSAEKAVLNQIALTR